MRIRAQGYKSPCGKSYSLPELLAAFFIHCQGRAEYAGTGIHNAEGFQCTLYYTVFTAGTVQGIEGK